MRLLDFFFGHAQGFDFGRRRADRSRMSTAELRERSRRRAVIVVGAYRMCVGSGFFYRFRAQIEVVFREEIIFAENILVLNAGNIARRFKTKIIFRKADFIQLRKIVFRAFGSDCGGCFLNIEGKIVFEREIILVTKRRR
jgi:hypothetical protein